MATNLRFGHPGYTLVAHLFRQFLVDNDLDTKEAEHVSIRKFYDWANEIKEENSTAEVPLFPDKDALQEVYDISDDDFEFINEIFDSPFDTCAHLYSWWPLLCLAGRLLPKNKILAISLAVSVRFEDGVTIHFPLPVGQQSEPFTDGMVMSLWRGQLSMIAHMLRDKSLDYFHDETVKRGLTQASLDVEFKENTDGDVGLCREESDYEDEEDDDDIIGTD